MFNLARRWLCGARTPARRASISSAKTRPTPQGGRIAVAPLARAVLGKAVGEIVATLGQDAEVLEIK